MSRNHRAPGVIRAICTDNYHHDSPEFAEHGFHHLRTLKLIHRPGGPEQDFTVTWRGPVSKAPVKDFRRADSLWVFKFECPCGLDKQRLETALEEQRNGEWRYLEFLQATSLITADIFVHELPGGTRARHRPRPVDLPEDRY